MLKLFISTGEVSGDMQAAALIKALRYHAEQQQQPLQLLGLGGPRTAAAGCRLIADTASLGSAGFVEALPYLIPGIRLQRRTLSALDDYVPDLTILIDYPGFNIPLAQCLRKRVNTPIIYYIPPEEWVWSTKGNRLLDRSAKMPLLTDKILAVHEVEAEFYRKIGCDVELVGHPLQDVLSGQMLNREQARRILDIDAQQKVIALIPASRRQELDLVWPVIAEAAAMLSKNDPDLIFLTPLASSFLTEKLQSAISTASQRFAVLQNKIRVINDVSDTQKASSLVIAAADLAITKSGTVTLELALQNIPQIAFYRLSKATIWIGRHLLGMTEADIENTILVNHIMQETIVPEVLLDDSPADTIAGHAEKLLMHDSPGRLQQLADYARLQKKLGAPGAVDRAAKIILTTNT